MVARIKVPQRLARALNYNEQKVALGAAELLWASGYLKAPAELNFYEKLERMEDLISRNNSKTNSLHISLNFSPEDVLTREKLIQIADDYMAQIGFGEQPYLVYQHFDAAHPHLHVLACSIRPDGTRIDTWKIGERLSEPARKNIEQVYGLVQADARQRLEAFRLKPISAEQVKYGKSPTKRAITNVLDTVLARYHYRSLPELNAILRQYNIEAALVHERGIVYRVLGAGVAVKASDIYSKPTLAYLSQRFAANHAPKEKEKTALRTAIDLVLKDKPTWKQLVGVLKRQGVVVVERRSETGQLYGVTFVDHKSRCVFNGSDLGKAYSAKALAAGCKVKLQEPLVPNLELADALLSPEERSEVMDFELKRTRRRKKKQQPD